MTADTYEVLALKYGTHQNRTRNDNFLFADDHARPDPIDYFVWVIRNQERTIVVDTGFSRMEAAERGREISHEPREVLQLIGIDADRVDTVILSHMHYDHAGTLDHFPAAHFHIQDAEVAFATGRCMCEPVMRRAFNPDHVCQLVKRVYSGRVEFHDGDGGVAPGVSVHHAPGHSRGLQCICVKTSGGYVVLASDVSHLYENMEKRQPFPIVENVESTLRSYDKLYALASSPAQVVPGHDPLVLKRYPALDARTQGIVHRLDVPRSQ
jgi:glyoxylase-like metal-dependent hydrolase (beta-lactamase superfamily II)